ncbi:MAG: DNA cytosine methyltransferase [Candidatus Fonsibacter sp.]
MEDEDSPIRLVSKAKKYRRSTPSAGVSRDCKGNRVSPRQYVEKLVRASAGPRAPPAQDTVTERQSVVRLGSDGAGYGSDYLALKLNGVKVETSFCAEIDTQKVELLHRVHDLCNDTDFVLYRDIKDRDNTAAPGCDVFITGAPCQAYSTAGRGAGLDDGKNRGVTIFYSLDYVRSKRPKVVVVENVRGLTFKQSISTY